MLREMNLARLTTDYYRYGEEVFLSRKERELYVENLPEEEEK